jgi:hypothetical protein
MWRSLATDYLLNFTTIAPNEIALLEILLRTIRVGVIDRKICRQSFKLMAILKRDDRRLWIGQCLLQGLGFRLGFRKIRLINGGQTDQANRF